MSALEIDLEAIVADPFVSRLAACAILAIEGGLDTAFAVALSGGPDSTALLLGLSAMRHRNPGLRLSAAHINHGLRGAESDGDEAFCRQLCASLNVPLFVERLDGAVRDECGLREARYAALASVAEQAGAPFVATGHTQDDQVETMLFRLFRGTGPTGLRGMEPIRPLTAKIQVVRPLLSLTRADVVGFLQRSGVKARSDSSNQDTTYARNYIRSEIVPAVAARFPGFAERMARCAQLLREDERVLEDEMQSVMSAISAGNGAEEQWRLKEFLAQPVSLRRRLIVDGMRRRGIEPSFDRCSEIIALTWSGPGAVTLDAQWSVRFEEGLLRWVEREEESRISPEVQFEQAVRIPGTTISLELGCAISIEPFAQQETVLLFPNARADQALVDLSAISAPLVVRRRRPGDVIRPFGMDLPVKLKKFIHTHKPLTAEANANWRHAIVLADQDEVVWVPGMGLSNKLKVDQQPTHRLRFMPLGTEELTIC